MSSPTGRLTAVINKEDYTHHTTNRGDVKWSEKGKTEKRIFKKSGKGKQTLAASHDTSTPLLGVTVTSTPLGYLFGETYKAVVGTHSVGSFVYA